MINNAWHDISSGPQVDRFPSTMSQEDFDIAWRQVKQVLRAGLDAKLPRGTKVIFVDYPVYGNIGDLLIYLGTELWLSDVGLDVLGRWSMDNFPFQRLPPDVTIICQGGGNWGDLYRHQEFRETLIQTYASNRIIILPQSIHYETRAAVERSRKLICHHEDVHLFLRDRESLAFCQNNFPNISVDIAPDMATWLYPIDKNLNIDLCRGESGRILYLMRKDREAPVTDHDLMPRQRDSVMDWRNLLPIEVAAARLARAVPFVARGDFLSRYLADYWKLFAVKVVNNASQKLLKYDNVVSSRLHGHILSSLLGIPNVIVDNSYGKLRRYYNAWGRQLTLCAMNVPTPGKFRQE